MFAAIANPHQRLIGYREGECGREGKFFSRFNANTGATRHAYRLHSIDRSRFRLYSQDMNSVYPLRFVSHTLDLTATGDFDE